MARSGCKADHPTADDLCHGAEAARFGHGVALGWHAYVRQSVEKGDLVRLPVDERTSDYREFLVVNPLHTVVSPLNRQKTGSSSSPARAETIFDDELKLPDSATLTGECFISIASMNCRPLRRRTLYVPVSRLIALQILLSGHQARRRISNAARWMSWFAAIRTVSYCGASVSGRPSQSVTMLPPCRARWAFAEGCRSRTRCSRGGARCRPAPAGPR